MTKARDLASAIPAPSTVSSAELGFLDGVTSAIQTQVDAKIAKTLTTTTGDIIYASGANTPARLGIGSSAQVLTVASGIPSWATASSGAMTRISTTTFSSVSAISIDGCFTSTYANYVAYLTFTGDTAQTNINVVMRVGGVSDTAGYSNVSLFASGGTPESAEDTGGTGVVRIGQHLEYTNGTKIEFYAPEIAKSTSLLSYSNSYFSSGGNGIYLVGAVHVDGTQFDGFRLQFDNSQSGTVRVYGLEN